MIDRRALIASALAYLGVRPMPDPVHPDTLAARFAELERRLAALERSPQLGQSSIRGGSLDVLDSSGDLVAQLRDTDVGQGVVVYDAAGNVVARLGSLAGSAVGFEVGSNPTGLSSDTWLAVTPTSGVALPFIGHTWRDPNVFKAVTGAAFASIWTSQVELLSSRAFFSSIGWSTDAATTGQLRVTAASGTAATATLSLSAASSGIARLSWLHGIALGGGPVDVTVEARRTGGGGGVNIYTPSTLAAGLTALPTVGGLT